MKTVLLDKIASVTRSCELKREVRISPRASSACSVSVTLARRTPSMVPMNSCLRFMVRELARSAAISSHRQHRCSIQCSPLHATE